MRKTLKRLLSAVLFVAMALSLVIKMKQSYGTLNTEKIRRLKG